MKGYTPLFELKKVQTDFPKIKIGSSKDAADFIRQFYSDDLEIYESFFVLLLNRANHTTGYAKVSQGGTAGTVVDLKIIAKYAVDSLASAVILAHNHPSGNKTPSDADISLTKKCVAGLAMLDIKVLDHIVLTADSYTSMQDEGIM